MSQSTKFGKKLFIFTLVIIVLMIAITAELIIAKRTSANTNANETSTDNAQDIDETAFLVSENDTYTTNAITYEDISDSITRGNQIDTVNYYEINGLIDETVQNAINKAIKAKAYEVYYEELDFLQNSLDEELQDLVGVSSYCYVGFNISNVLSIEYLASLDWISEEIDLESYIDDVFHYAYAGYTCSLVDGEEIKVEDLFLKDTNLTYIVQRAIYNDLAWEYMYNSEEYTNDFSEMDYEDIENKVYSQVQKFKRLQENDEIEYYINGSLYIYGVNDNQIEIKLKDYADYVTLYNKYLTDTNIYLDNTLATSYIFPFEVISIDKSSQIYREFTENSFVDLYIYSSDELDISSEDMDKLLSLLDKIKEEICSNGESFVNMGYVFFGKDEDSGDFNVSLNFINYAVEADRFDEFYQVIRNTYQEANYEIGVHYISNEYDYATLYDTYFWFYYDTETEQITGVESCWSDLKLFEEYVTDEDEEYEEDQELFEEYYSQAEEILSTMTIEEKVGQMFIAEFPEENVVQEIQAENPGGYVLFKEDFEDETKESMLQKLTDCQNASKINLILAVDEEGGTVVRVSSNKAFRDETFKSPQELWEEGQLDRILEDSVEKSDLLKSIGLNMNLVPVADVPTSTDDFIYARSYGRDAENTAVYVARLVETMNESGMLSSLKHFPGYGNNVDTHTGVSIDERDYSVFEESDFLPFISGIEAGAPTVLVSHNIVKCMDENYPASLSENVHDILRYDLGFTGLIITDDLSMDAVKEYADNGQAAIQAVETGNDMIISKDFVKQKQKVLDAIASGEISEDTINTAVRRILACKLAYGII